MRKIHRILDKTLGLIMLIFALILSEQSFAADSSKAIALVKIKVESSQLKKICTDLSLTCSRNAALWKKKVSKDSKVYLIDDSPQLIELSKESKRYKVVNSWNFKTYQHRSLNSHDGELKDYGIEVLPVFYPLNHQQLAVAIVLYRGITYSGGGKGKQIADFVMLEPQGKYKLALAEILFHSYEMTQACFSEKDYKKSPHCHDEQGSNLSIQFQDVGQPYYQWTLNYNHFTWKAFKPEKYKKIEKTSKVVMPFEQNNK